MKPINYDIKGESQSTRFEKIRRAQWLKQRRQLVKYWPWAGAGGLLLWISLYTFFLLRIPYLVNPYKLYETIDAVGDKSESLALTVAVLTPVLMIVLFFVLVIMMILGFFIMAKERKYLDIIDEYESKTIDQI